jgi:DNA ligase-1
MLAREVAADIDPAGFLVSEKCDGVRAVRDGRALRFRSGLPVAAPASFTRHLPPLALDGALWLARGRFAERAQRIEAVARELAGPQLVAVPQRRLDEVVAGGGEGLVLHRADALGRSGRSADPLKLTPLQDAEAVVVGNLAGQSRPAVRLGAPCVRLEDGREILGGTGFSDAERAEPPPIGTTVTFTYRGTTTTGVPRFASYPRRNEP